MVWVLNVVLHYTLCKLTKTLGTLFAGTCFYDNIRIKRCFERSETQTEVSR